MVTQSPPSISERVQFWEQQQKINDLLIPQVVDLHDKVNKIGLVVQHSSQMANALERDSAYMKGEYHRMMDSFESIRDETIAAAELYRNPIGRLDSLSDSIKSMEKKAKDVSGELADIRSKVNANVAHVDELSGQLGIILSNIEFVKQSVTTERKRLDKTQSDLNDANQQIGELFGNIESIDKDITQIQSFLRFANNRIDSLMKSKSEHELKLNQLQADHSALAIRHDLLHKRVEDLESQLLKYWNRGSYIPAAIAVTALIVAIIY